MFFFDSHEIIEIESRNGDFKPWRNKRPVAAAAYVIASAAAAGARKRSSVRLRRGEQQPL